MLTDENVRKAFVQCLDIPTLRSVVFQGVNWEEDVPGSLLTPVWADGYENNMPDDVTSLTTADERTAAAKKTLEDAGYALDDDGYYAKDGTEVAFSFTTFGDSNTVKNRAAAIIKMAKDAGIKIDQDAKPSSEFSTTLTSGSWDICLFGWVSTPTSVWNGPQIYGSDSPSNFTHLGSADLDAELAKIISIEDHTEQMKALNAAEKKALASYGFVHSVRRPRRCRDQAGPRQLRPRAVPHRVQREHRLGQVVRLSPEARFLRRLHHAGPSGDVSSPEGPFFRDLQRQRPKLRMPRAPRAGKAGLLGNAAPSRQCRTLSASRTFPNG